MDKIEVVVSKSKDEMSSKERLLKVASLGQPDRIPIICRGRYGAKYFGYTEKQLDEDIDKYVEVEVGTLNEFGGDCVYGGITSGMMEEVLGSRFERLQDTEPKSLRKPLIESPADIGLMIKKVDNLDFERGETLAMVLSRTRKLKQAVGPNIPVVAWISAPFRSACMLRGTSQIYMDMYENPELVHTVQQMLMKLWTTWTEACVKAGTDIILTSNPTANSVNISKKHYQEYVHPYSKEMFTALRNKGFTIFFHPCGDWNDRFELICDEGYHVLHVDQVDLASIKSNWGHKVGIWGNVKTIQTLLQGSANDVKQESIECIKKAGKGGGYILGANCVIPRETPPENVRAMIEAGFEHGRYVG